MAKVTKELERLLSKASKALDKAQEARQEVLDYLEDKYGIEATDYNQYFEDECTWCYGLNERYIRKEIESR